MSEQLDQSTPKNEGRDIYMSSTEGYTEAVSAPKTKRKNIFIICGAILLIGIAILFVFLHESHFEKVESEVLQIVGMVGGGDGYFTIDTYPDQYESMDDSVVAMLLPSAEKNALKAIKYANEELGFNGSLYSQMMETSALMGRQSEENDKYKVSWTYHPDDGLEVTYEVR